MTHVYPEQLASHLRHEKLNTCYLVMGNEPLFLQESVDLIRKEARQHNFTEYFSFTLDIHTNWESIFSFFQERSLFNNRQIISLLIPDNGINASIDKQLQKLAMLLNTDLLLIIISNKTSKVESKNQWYKTISQSAVIISCQTPKSDQLSSWISARAKNMKIELDQAANELICQLYEGNLLALSQTLAYLATLYTDGKLTLPRVAEAVNNAAHFYPFQWVEAILLGKSKRAWQTLQQLSQEGIDPVILIRAIQREILLLILLKNQIDYSSLNNLFYQYKVWQNRRVIITQALKLLSLQKLYQAAALLSQIEVIIKQDYDLLIWSKIELLTLLLCGKALPESMINAVSIF
ncbi:DNA polymerase III subunit delta [Candidatus Profftia tarda]|uniref:DNA polymerase III subunit delta n=1 Tax=Candidatus Profftia tarda TaxID=1177216 RepID=A0A8E4EYI0_9ENTR|nr:DNA polymerase III subunit delta [Candidatus Profftia tarda]CAD6510977.1 DNA polymerase III subunit delta [Candidatus Profftia tarda]